MPTVKAVDDERFRAALAGSIRPVAGAKSAGQEQPQEDASEAPATKSTVASATPATVTAQRDREPLQAGVTPSIVNGKEIQVTSTQPLISGVPKKPLHKDVGNEGTPTDETSTGDAPLVPTQVEVHVGAALPITVEAGLPADTASAKAQESASSMDVSVKPKSKGPTTSARTTTDDTRKADGALTTASTDSKPDAAAQVVPIAPMGVAHELGHVGIAVGPQAIAVDSLGGSHRAVSTGTTAVAKASDAGSAQGVSDGGSQATDLKTLVATPNVLEVGIASGSHGWLRVRAEFSQTGEVAASVVAASAGAAQGLHKELPALSAYLAGERVGVDSLVVNAADKSAGAQDAALNNGAGNAGGSQAGTNQRGRDIPSSSASTAGSDSDSFGLDEDAGLALASINLPTVFSANGSGSWLSVRV